MKSKEGMAGSLRGPFSERPRKPVDPKEVLRKHLNAVEAGKLCTYLTGLSIDSIEMYDRLYLDNGALRGEYGLPEWDALTEDTSWYESFLRGIAEREGIEVADISECGNFFNKYPTAKAALFDSSWRIGVSLDRGEKLAYEKAVNFLEHEIIHALQVRMTPSMPVEVREYQAYVAGADPFLLLFQPDYIRRMFEGGVLESVVLHYDRLSEREGRPIIPVWSSQEFFSIRLREDTVSRFSSGDRELFESLRRKVEQSDIDGSEKA